MGILGFEVKPFETLIYITAYFMYLYVHNVSHASYKLAY